MAENEGSGFGSKVAKGCGIVFLIFFGLAMLGAIVGDPENDNADDMKIAGAINEQLTGAGDNSSSDTTTDVPEPSNWSYRESHDELRNATNYRADIRSNNSHDFGFPYGNGNHLSITVRQHPEWGRDVIFKVDSGQLMCDIYDCRYTISFDGNAEGLTLVPPQDHDSTVLFAKYPDAIIRKLKSSDRTIVELQFYQEGNRQFVFDTKGLNWER